MARILHREFRCQAEITAVLLLGAAGCAGPARVAPPEDRAETISAADVLTRCAETYATIQRYQAFGAFEREAGHGAAAVPIAWDFDLPGRGRLQLDMDVLVVADGYWWVYRHAEGAYERRRQFDRTPLETSAFLMSGGVSFLLPALLERGRRALGWTAARGYDDWRLTGIEWCADHPCYLVSRSADAALGLPDLRLWIDQETSLVRGWTAIERTRPGGPLLRVSCTYFDIKLNPRIAPSRFDLLPPQPISYSRKAPGETGRDGESLRDHESRRDRAPGREAPRRQAVTQKARRLTGASRIGQSVGEKS